MKKRKEKFGIEGGGLLFGKLTAEKGSGQQVEKETW